MPALRKVDAHRRTASSEHCAEARGYATHTPCPPLRNAERGTMKRAPLVVIPRLQEVDAIVADEVDDPVLGREPATPHTGPEVLPHVGVGGVTRHGEAPINMDRITVHIGGCAVKTAGAREHGRAYRPAVNATSTDSAENGLHARPCH